MTCSKCARDLSIGQAWCDVCKGPAVFSPRELQNLQVDIRARVLWVDPVELIREHWIAKGASIEEIRRAYDEGMRERQRHFRKRGLLDLLMALGCFLLAAGGVWLHQAVFAGEIAFTGRAMGLLLVALMLLPVTGLFLMFRGIGRVVRGGAKEKSASDLA